MLRTLVLAGLVTLLGVTASEAQYQDSAPPDEYEYDDEYYDEELLGSPDYYDDDYDDGRGYSEPDIDIGIFGSLGHDGSWHFAAGFGWVWRPYAAASWRPYSMGRWVWTNHGWTWVSYEPFGWATYHYGYWARDPMLGWVWIPGYEWSACRVQFAYYDNYISWAPLAPPGYYCPQPWSTAGISFWFTIGASNFCDPYPVRHCVTPKYKSYYTQTVAYKSPDRHYVERYSGTPVRTSKVQFKNTTWSRGDGGSTKFTTRGERTKATFSKGGDSRGAKFSSKSNRVVTKSDRVVTKSTRSQKSESRFVAPRKSGSSGSYAMKGKSSQEVKRQFQTQESRRTSSKREAVKSQRAQQSNRAMRAERSSKQSKQQFRAPSQSRESRVVTRTERSSKQQFKSGAVREQRSVQKAQRAERTSRPSFQRAERSSGERKAAVSSKKSSGSRDVARTKSSSKGRGKAK